MPLVSVIIPVYNGQDHLSTCLESVIGQTYKYLEVLVIDDGSTDGSHEIAAGIADRDPRLTVIGLSNGGVSIARNTGISRAKGEYIVFVDSDDMLHRDSISHLVATAEECRCDIALHLPTSLSATSEDFPLISRSSSLRMMTGRQACENMLYQRGIPGAPWAKLIRRSTLGPTRFPAGIQYAEDIIFTFDVLSKSKTVALSSFGGYGYRRHPGSALARTFGPARMDGLVACDAIVQEAQYLGGRLASASRSRLLVEAVLILGDIDRSGIEWPQEAKRCNEVIRRLRVGVLRDRSAFGGIAWRFALGSFVPRRFVVRLVHMRRKLKGVARSGSGT